MESTRLVPGGVPLILTVCACCCDYPYFIDKETKAPRGCWRSHSQQVVEPGSESGNLAPEFILGVGSREGSRVAHHWELEHVWNLNCNMGAERSGQGKTSTRRCLGGRSYVDGCFLALVG